MSVSGILGWINIRGMRLRIDLPDEIYRNLDTLVTVRLTNVKRRFPSFLLTARVLGQAVAFDVLDRGEEMSDSFMFRFAERGEQAIAGGEISSPFPINFFVRSRWIMINRQLTVFPTPLSCGLPVGYGGRERSGSPTDSAKGYDGDVFKITDYTGSDPLKLVHWRLTAKHGELKVKEMSAAAHEPVLLDLNVLPGRNMEENLSHAAYLVNMLIRKNRGVGLKLGERVYPPAASREHRLKLLALLAQYDKY